MTQVAIVYCCKRNKMNNKLVKMYCPTCKKDVKAIEKMFHTRICPNCSKVLASDYPLNKVGR